jgi:hypothetical protein
MREGVVPRITRRVEDNAFHSKVYDPSLRIANPGKLGRVEENGKTIDTRLAEQAGWIPSAQLDPALLLASLGGYEQAMRAHIDAVSTHERISDNMAVIKSALDSYTRPADFTWVVLTNGDIGITGEFKVPEADALRVTVDCHGMLDASTVDRDIELPAMRIGSFVVHKKQFEEERIHFSEDVQLVGLTSAATHAARAVAQDAAVSFVRPSRNRSRVLSVSVQALANAADEAGPVISARLFDIEYRWRDLEKEQARFDGSAAELNGDLSERTQVVANGVQKRQLVAAVVSGAVRASPHPAEVLATRLRRYDDRLITNPELLHNQHFLLVMAVVSDTLMPLLKAALQAQPERRSNQAFVTNYNLCARYCSQGQL